jgi:uncharacterized protein
MEKKSRGRPKKQKEIVTNTLTEAIFGNPLMDSNQIAQTGTLFKGLRWYLVSNMRQLLSELYAEIGTVQTIVDIPVEDALRGGIVVQTKQLEPDQITELENYMQRNDDYETFGYACKWNRLYGGAGIIIISGQDYSKPLDVEALKQGDKIEFRAVDMWELFHDMQNTGDLGDAMDYNFNNVEYYNYYGKKVHHTHVLIMKGKKAPSFIRPRLRGWGMSVLESLVRPLNQYLKATDLTFEVLDEFKLDIYKIKGLTATLLNPMGTQKIQQRVQLANQQKNYQNAITMDSEDDYVQKQLSFSGIAETMDGIRIQLASDLRMPLTKLFGISPAGFNTGEGDIENYNSMIESDIRAKIKYHILKIVKIRCIELFGFTPDDLNIDFMPLRILSAEQEENVSTQKFNRLLQARERNEITSEQFIEAVNRDDLLGVQI